MARIGSEIDFVESFVTVSDLSENISMAFLLHLRLAGSTCVESVEILVCLCHMSDDC